jgi:hypothetical protein
VYDLKTDPLRTVCAALLRDEIIPPADLAQVFSDHVA